MKEETKSIYLKNLGIKIVSVLLAMIIWMIIINIDDPYKTRTFSVNKRKCTSIGKQGI